MTAQLLIRCPVDGWMLNEPLHELFPTSLATSIAGNNVDTISSGNVSVLDLKNKISALRGGAPVGGLRLLYKGRKLSDNKNVCALLQEHASETVVGSGEPSPALLYLLDSSLLSSSRGSPAFVASPGSTMPRLQLPQHYSQQYQPLSPTSPQQPPAVCVRPDERSLAAAADWLGSDQAVGDRPGRDGDEQYLLVATSLLHLSQAQRRYHGTFNIQSALNAEMRTSTPQPAAGSAAAGAAAAGAPLAPAAAAAVAPIVPDGRRWIHFSVLLRFALAVCVIGFDAPPMMQAMYAAIGIIYYIHEVRKLREIAMRQQIAVAEAAAAVPGAPPAAPAVPAPPRGRVGRWMAYWGDVYNEGFPVPQSPGILLDIFSLVMGLFASLYPHWDPRPVTPIVRAVVPAPVPPPLAAAAAAAAAAEGAADAGVGEEGRGEGGGNLAAQQVRQRPQRA